MRIVLAAGLLAGIAFLVSTVTGEEPAPKVPFAAVRVVRAEGKLGFDVEPGAWRVLSEEEAAALDRAVDEAAAPESSGRWVASAGAGEPAPFHLAMLGRVRYVQDYDAEAGAGGAGGPTPVRSTMREGILADLAAKYLADEKVVVFTGGVTRAALVRPIATFATKLGAETVTIELPELLVQRTREEVRVPAGRTAVWRVDGDYVLLSAEGEEGAPLRPGGR